jgi:hypothetical protein
VSHLPSSLTPFLKTMSSLINIPFEPREQHLTSLLLYSPLSMCVAFSVDHICPTSVVPFPYPSSPWTDFESSILIQLFRANEKCYEKSQKTIKTPPPAMMKEKRPETTNQTRE